MLGRIALATGIAVTVGLLVGFVAQAGAVVAAPPSVVTVGDAAIAEGHTKTRTVTVPVTLDVPAGTSQTVHWAVGAGSATPGAVSAAPVSADFKPASGTLTFTATTAVKYVPVVVYGDTRGEDDETVTVTLSAPSAGLVLGRAAATVTIRDDETAPGIVASIGSVAVGEGDSGKRVVKFPITLSTPAAGAVVRYHLVPFTATGGWTGAGVTPVATDFADRNGATQTATFTAAGVQKTASVTVPTDLATEGDEFYVVVLDSTTIGTVGDSGLGTILDDDPADTDPAAFGPAAAPVGSPAPGSVLVPCSQAATHLTLTASAHLDPTCTWTRGVDIATSGVTLDCRGANLVRDPAYNGAGIRISADTATALSNITVRNCNVSGFQGNLNVTRNGFKDLAVGSEYLNGFSNIRIDNSRFVNSVNSSVFVNAFVTGVTFSHSLVENAGAVGLYLEAGSKDNVIERSIFRHNGYRDVDNGPVATQIGTTTVYYLSTGREGIAVDGSRDNLIQHNLVEDNSSGGIMMYKNCGEDASQAGHWVRNYGSTGNRLRHNVVRDQPNGIWIGSRAAENQYFMDCSDTPIVNTPGSLTKVFPDPVTDTVVEFNHLDGNVNAIRIEGDGATIRGNTIEHATRGVLVGTKHRTAALAQPITGSVVTGNTANATTEPYGWVWGKGTLTFSANIAAGAAGRLNAGTQPTINPFLFVLGFVPAP